MDAPPIDIVDRHRESVVVEVAADTCDARRCPAKAFGYAQLAHGSLSYCSHHATQFWDELNKQAKFVVDLRDMVLK